MQTSQADDLKAQRQIALDGIEDCALQFLERILGLSEAAKDEENSLGSHAFNTDHASLSASASPSSYLQSIVTSPTRMVSQVRSQAQAFKVMEEAHHASRTAAFVTKRDLFYRDVGLFNNRQTCSDAHIDNIAAAFKVEREAIGIRAAAKGLLTGSFDAKLHSTTSYMQDETDRPATLPQASAAAGVSTMHGSSSTQHLLPSVHDLADFQSDAAWVLVVEKEAIFQILRQHAFASGDIGNGHNLGPGLIITAKGYPDRATQQFLQLLAQLLNSVPFFCMTDGDPHGIDIFRVYKYGNGTAAKPGSLALPSLQWLGLRTADFVPDEKQQPQLESRQPVQSEARNLLALSLADRKKARSLLALEWLPVDLRTELESMLASGLKAEMEVLLQHNPVEAVESSSRPARSETGSSASLLYHIAEAICTAMT